jgi:hypothetical protein
MKSVLFPVALLTSLTVMSQTFSIKRLEVAGDKINLYYDLVDTVSSRTYTIALYSSHDNFVLPVQKASGDLGLEVRPGRNRKIVWNAKEELGAAFNGKVGLEVRGRLYIPFVRLEGLNKKLKRLTPTEITWSGGTQQNILNFDLYRGEERVTRFANIANVGHYILTIPTTVKPGKGYRFKITDSRNKDQIVNSAPFRVKRKIPLLMKAIPVVVIGLGSYLVVLGNKGRREIPDPSIPD